MNYYVQITFDTESIRKQYSSPSQNPDLPTEIAESYCYIVTSSTLLKGSHSHLAELFQCENAEKIRLYGSSASHNFEDSVLIYSIRTEPIGRFPISYTPVGLIRSSIQPEIPDTLPARVVPDELFPFLESNSTLTGKNAHEISFALYTRDQTGLPSLFGYFKYTAIFSMLKNVDEQPKID